MGSRAPHGKWRRIALRVLASLVLPLLGANAQADGPHRYRCFPSDGSPSYTTAWSCRGEVLRREPLTRDEIAALWEIENRGRPFTRCTAIDGRYSLFVKEDEACPAVTDKRTVEYSQKSIEQRQYDQKLIDAAAASVEPARAQNSGGATPSAVDPVPPAREATAPVAAPIPTVAPPAVPAAPVPAERPRTRSWSKWVFVALAVVLGIWGLIRWRSGAARGSEFRPATSRQRPRPSQESAATRVKPAPEVDENQRCARLLQALVSDAPVHGGLAFRDALKQAQLDHSLDSLQRLDELLRRLQAGIKQPIDEFVNDSASQNFMRLAAFYIGMTVAKLGAMPVKWLDFAQAKQLLADLESGFETSLVCMLGGRCYFPLALVAEILLLPNARRNLPDWAQQALQLAPPPMPSILRSSLQGHGAAPLDGALQAAIHKAGVMAAWSMFMVEGGANGAPTVYAPGADGTGTFRDFGFYGEGDAAFEAAERLMEQNPDRLPYQVMSFDGYANLHTGRTDALTIELRVYAGISAPGQAEFRMGVACPYRNANDPAGFAIYSPKLMQCSMDDSAHAAIFKAFYEGVTSFRAGSFDWFQRLDERI